MGGLGAIFGMAYMLLLLVYLTTLTTTYVDEFPALNTYWLVMFASMVGVFVLSFIVASLEEYTDQPASVVGKIAEWMLVPVVALFMGSILFIPDITLAMVVGHPLGTPSGDGGAQYLSWVYFIVKRYPWVIHHVF
ncbi:hypothetical protein RQP46_003976 [Phenoliferia psychrophenolica]